MTASVPTSTFANLEEIGPRLRAFREAEKLPVSRMCEKSGLSPCVVVSIEKGTATTRSLQSYADALGVEIELTATDTNGTVTPLTLADVQSFAVKSRLDQGMAMNALGRACGVQATSVHTFETSARTNVKSASRYLKGLGLTLTIELKADGQVLESSTSAPVIAVPRNREDLALKLGTAIRGQRLHSGLTKTALAKHSGVAHLTISKIEEGFSASLPTFNTVVNSMGNRMTITLTDSKGTVIESPAALVPVVLDRLRESSGVSIADMARKMGTTYRAVKIFPDGSRNPVQAIERYAATLGLTLDFKLEEMSHSLAG